MALKGCQTLLFELAMRWFIIATNASSSAASLTSHLSLVVILSLVHNLNITSRGKPLGLTACN